MFTREQENQIELEYSLDSIASPKQLRVGSEWLLFYIARVVHFILVMLIEERVR
jgi:hypothetical protein